MVTGRLEGAEIEILSLPEPARVVTIDVEDWFHSNFRSAPQSDVEPAPRRVEAGVDRVLELLDSMEARATFFVLGEVAREHPALVPRIAAGGHEVCCHGMHHDLVYEQGEERFVREVRAARQLLQDQSGQRVAGFRAPSWSITSRVLWALDRLAEIGFRYDSSIFPVANYMYGIDGAPTSPFRVTTSCGRRLVEAPPPILSLGPARIGMGGGFYLRLFPLWIQRRVMRSYLGRGALFLAYLHPREFDSGSWRLRLPLSPTEQILHRLGLRSVPRKLVGLLREGVWRPLGEVLQGVLDPESPVEGDGSATGDGDGGG